MTLRHHIGRLRGGISTLFAALICGAILRQATFAAQYDACAPLNAVALFLSAWIVALSCENNVA